MILFSLTACGSSSIPAPAADQQTEASSNTERKSGISRQPGSEAAETNQESDADADKTTEMITGNVFFGSYPQESGSVSPLEWIVLDQNGESVLLLTKESVESLPWHNARESITWDKSDIRAWLNSDFLRTAFTQSEQDSIILAHLDNGDDLGYGTSVGESTQDKVFLLSGAELERYLPSSDVRTVKPTSYAISHGAYTNGSGNCAWWLRSPGMTESSPAYVASAGDIGNRAHEANETIIGVRPAIWVNVDALYSDETRAVDNPVTEGSEN